MTQKIENDDPVQDITDYVINVKTSDRFGAGTDADVYIQLLGDNEYSEKLEPFALKSSQKLNKFERNSFDQFTICNEISRGKLEKLKVWHDNSGIGPSWHLEFIEVSDIKAHVKYRFPCHRWLSVSEDDGQICRTLRCTEISAGPKQTVQMATGVVKNRIETATNRLRNGISVSHFFSKPSSSFESAAAKSAKIRNSDDSLEKINAAKEHIVIPGQRLRRTSNANEQNESNVYKDTAAINTVPCNRHGGKFSLIEPTNKIEVFSARPHSTTSVYGPYSSSDGSTTSQNVVSQKKAVGSSLYGPYSSRS